MYDFILRKLSSSDEHLVLNVPDPEKIGEFRRLEYRDEKLVEITYIRVGKSNVLLETAAGRK